MFTILKLKEKRKVRRLCGAGGYTGEGGDGFIVQKNGKDISSKIKNNPEMKDGN